MRTAFYSPYLDSFGGGERYLATAAEFLAEKGEVVIFWDESSVLRQLETRFNLNLKKVKVLPNILIKNIFERWKILKNFDLVFVLSNGSIPAPFAKKNILHFQEPFKINGRNWKNKFKLKKYQVICNSNFTKKYIDESFGVNSLVLYPPVDINFFTPGNKEKIILSVGRFLPRPRGKKQEILIEAFRSALSAQRSAFNNWQLWFAGGVGDKKYFEDLRNKAKNLPVKFFPDNNAVQLQKLYRIATFFWHAKGFGENINTSPEFAEHFGISIVEAQSSGAVPIVFQAGGLTEIIEDGKDGLFWGTQDELIEKTKSLIENSGMLHILQQKAIEAAKQFSKENFWANLKGLI